MIGHADADGRAVHGGDDGRAQLPGVLALRALAARALLRLLAALEGVASPLEVGPRAEHAAGPGDHDRAHLVVGVEQLERLRGLGAQLPVEGVAALRPVECDRGDPVAHVYQDRLVRRRHGSASSSGPGSDLLRIIRSRLRGRAKVLPEGAHW
jgi:hypothetical protein